MIIHDWRIKTSMLLCYCILSIKSIHLQTQYCVQFNGGQNTFHNNNIVDKNKINIQS